MNDAQKTIDSVLTEHQFDWSHGGARCSGKNCRDWRGYPMQHRQHLAAEIDAALGLTPVPLGFITQCSICPQRALLATQPDGDWTCPRCAEVAGGFGDVDVAAAEPVETDHFGADEWWLNRVRG